MSGKLTIIQRGGPNHILFRDTLRFCWLGRDGHHHSVEYPLADQYSPEEAVELLRHFADFIERKEGGKEV